MICTRCKINYPLAKIKIFHQELNWRNCYCDGKGTNDCYSTILQEEEEKKRRGKKNSS